MNDAAIDQALTRFGFPGLRDGQRAVIDALLSGASALAVFPTGGGKSLCYQLPALLVEGLTVVVSPLIALMKDQIDFLERRGISAARLDSSLSFEETLATQRRLRSGETKILYVAPERFANERFVALLREIHIGIFAIDEAHCISEWGHNFRPDYLKLAETARDLGASRVLALTATATPSVAKDIQAAFAIRDEHAIVTGFYRRNLELWTTPVTDAGRDALLAERLTSRPPGPAIVYVTLQKTAERVAALLAARGLPARAYHAGLSPEERTAVQDGWMASDRGIVVATIAFGMGIDKSNVRYVYHYNLPKSLESYSQEIGRAGRDGERSIVELLACGDDLPVLENFAYGDTPTRTALLGVVRDLLAAPEVDVSLFSLGGKHDLRPLVLRTALTYLELAGALRQSTPRYAGYEARLLLPLPDILERLKGEPGAFLASLFATAKKGRIWHAFDPDAAAAHLGQPRDRVVRALEYLEQQGWAELRPSDLRHRFTRLVEPAEAERLAGELGDRFDKREAGEMARVGQVLDLVTANGCQSARLASHFGEVLSEACGHCTYCRTGEAQVMPAPHAQPPLPAGFDREGFEALRERQGKALGEPRQAARFLCGLTSPATTQAKLSRHALFGSLESRRFGEVLALVAQLVVLLVIVSLTGCAAPSVVGRVPGGAAVVSIPLRRSTVYLVKVNPPVLIDAGSVGDMPELERAVRAEGVSMRSLGLVILTQASAERAGLAAELRQSTGAKVVLGLADTALASAGHDAPPASPSSWSRVSSPFVLADFPELVPDLTVREDRALDLRAYGLDGRAVVMPGSTPGSLAVVLSDHTAFVGGMLENERGRESVRALMGQGVERFYVGGGDGGRVLTREGVAGRLR